jgi:hypothetical protein
MKTLFLAAVLATVLIAVAIYLPWWVFLLVIFAILAPVAWMIWKVISTIKKEVIPAIQEVAKGMPRAQERLCNLPAGEPFRGNGFTFTLPVACEVSQTVIDDLEVLLLKPKLNDVNPAASGLMVVSTIPRDELKTRINNHLESIFAQVREHIARLPEEGQGMQTGNFVPLEVSGLQGECRRMEFTREGKHLHGETVYLGEHAFSVGWALFCPAEGFTSAAARYRELASLIERVKEPIPVEATVVEKSN